MGYAKHVPSRFWATRTIGDRRFHVSAIYDYKTDAIRAKSILKARGELVRVIKTKHGHEVWVAFRRGNPK